MKSSGGWTIDSLSLVEVGNDKVIAAAHVMDDDGKRRDGSAVLITFRDGKIVDMQDCRSQDEAERFARRH